MEHSALHYLLFMLQRCCTRCFLCLNIRNPAQVDRFWELFMTWLLGKSALLFLPVFHSHSTSSPSSKFMLSVRCYQPCNSFISLLSSPFFCSYCLFLCLTIRPEISLLPSSSLLTRTAALYPLGSEEGGVWSSYVLCHVSRLASVCAN